MRPRPNTWNDLDTEDVGENARFEAEQQRVADALATATKEIIERLGPQGSLSTVRSGGVIIGAGQGVGAYTGGIRKSNIEPDGDLIIGSNVDTPEGVSLACFVNAQDYNAEAMDEGDILIGNNSNATSNMKWDASEGQFQFRYGQTITAYMDTDGTLKFLAGEIGGWVIEATSLTDAAGLVGLSSLATPGTDIRIWAGHADPSAAPFRVTEDGALFASNATIVGYISASSGKIAGWSISPNEIFKTFFNVGISLNSAVPEILVGNMSGTHIIIDGANQRIRSSNFVAGLSGSNWDTATGDAEFNNITARGELKTFLFTAANQMAVAGNIIVSKDAGKLGANVSSAATTVNFGKALTVGDWIKIQGPDDTGANNLEWMLIGSLVSGTTYNVTRNVDGSGANGWLKDTPFVVIGHSGDSRIELVAGASGSIQLITQGAAWNTQTVQAEMSTVAGAITAGGGNVKINASGVVMSNNAQSFIFKNQAGTGNAGLLYASNADTFWISNQTPGKQVLLAQTPASGTDYLFARFSEHGTGKAYLLLDGYSVHGAVLEVGAGSTRIFGGIDNQESVFNEDGLNIDHRFEGDTDPNLVVMDAGLNAVGIGGAAESGYKAKIYGNFKMTGGMSIGSSSVNVFGNEIASLANNATATLTPLVNLSGTLAVVQNGSNGFRDTAFFIFEAYGQGMCTLISDPNATYSHTATTAGKVNIYYSSSNLIIENKTGETINNITAIINGRQT